MNVKKYQAKVTEIENIIPNVFTVNFFAEKEFRFRPGQFLHLALDQYNPSDPWPESRAFSIQSSHRDKEIKITYSAIGTFTKRMARELIIGKIVWLKLPYGDIFQRDFSNEHCVFIAGGTGITPFLSLFNHDSFKEFTNPKLYFGLRSSMYNIYKSELEKALRNHAEFDINYVYENVKGSLNINEIYKINGNTTYFLSGPPVMIKSFKSFLLSKDINNKNIITDDWE